MRDTYRDRRKSPQKILEAHFMIKERTLKEMDDTEDYLEKVVLPKIQEVRDCIEKDDLHELQGLMNELNAMKWDLAEGWWWDAYQSGKENDNER